MDFRTCCTRNPRAEPNMLVKADRATDSKTASRNTVYLFLFVSLCAVIVAATFSEALSELVRRWMKQEEYSHGFLIPAIVAWLLWTRRDALVASIGQPSWIGPVLILLAAAMHIVGKLSALFVLSQLAFIVTLIGVTLGLGGYSLLKVCFVPIIFLIFAIPLPYFIDSVL